MHNNATLEQNDEYEKVFIGGRSVWGTWEGKNYRKKGYFESADELLPLRNNLSLHMTVKKSVELLSEKAAQMEATVGVLKVE